MQKILQSMLCQSLLLLALPVLPLHAAEFNKLAFGSCNHGHLPQPMWSVIGAHKPDLFLWTGDVVYADTTDAEKMRAKYQQQLDRPEYIEFTSNVPVTGIWDDHDFGINNGGKNNPVKESAQQIFLDFLGEPAGTERRTQEGIYTSKIYGNGENTVKLYMLDARYHRDRTGGARSDILGSAQWEWLENEIKSSDAAINIFVSGVSVMSPQFPLAEEWNDFKWSRKKLFRLMRKHQLPGVLFLTGDRHFSSHFSDKVGGQVYHEFMSSGLTHYMHRKNVSRVFRYVYGDTYSYFGRNFSLLTFNWDAQPLRLNYEVFDTENKRQVLKSLSLIDGFWSDNPPR